MKHNETYEELQLEVEKLKCKLAEAEDTLRAIRNGEVDALIVSMPDDDQVFTLKGAERPYRILMEKMKEGAVTLAGEDTIFYCNQGFADMLKRPLEKMIGNGISQFVLPDEKTVFEELLRQGRESGSKGEATFLAGDGAAVPVYLSINAMLLDGLSIVYLVATDITERKQAEEALQKAHDELEMKVWERTAELVKANEELNVEITCRKRFEEELRESEERYRNIIETAHEGIATGPPEGGFTFVNQRMADMLGYAKEEITGKTALDFMDDDQISYISQLRKDLKEGKRLQVECKFRKKNGSVLWTLASSSPLFDVEGRYVGNLAIHSDITERKQMEKALSEAHDELEIRIRERTVELLEANKALKESEARYRELTESIEDLFYAMDKDLRFTYWNNASEALTGIPAKDAIGKSLYELFPDVKGTKVEQFYIDVLKAQQPNRLEHEYQLGNKKLMIEINAYPTRTGISFIAKDITEKKKLESQLLRAQRMESIGTLAGGIAHDLNNVLTPVMLSLQLLKHKLQDEQSQKLLTVLENNSQRGAALIKQVLSFARGIEGERKPLQLTYLILEIEKVIKETFPRNTEIRSDLKKDLFTISGDATQLHQVIMNLCVNARDAMPEGGILSITAENFFVDEHYERINAEAKAGHYIVISVSDTGIGIPTEVLDRIFEPFFTTKEFGKGTGLGLSTALAIVKSHGGFINVYSEVGKGTIFRVYLPAIKTEMQSAEKQQHKLLTGHGELVLVAEDEELVREVTVSTLEGFGYNVLAASNGAEAVALYAQHKDKIKVVLMDMMMPVMDGETSIRAIRKINPEARVIVVSGLAEKDRLARIESNGTQILLPKPYTAERLLKTLDEVINTG